MNSATKLPIHGVFCAAATPVLEDGSPDHPAFAAHCHALLREGCDGVALLGTTGEANSFGIAERHELLDKVIGAGIDPKRLMPGTGQTNVADTIALTRHAVDAGIGATVLLPPFYYKGVSDEGLFRFYAEVIEGVGRDGLRIVLYHIPPIALVGISDALVRRLLAAFPGIVVGIKDSSGKIDSMELFARNFPSLAVFSGADPLMLPLLRAGGAGCITSSSNLIAGLLRVVFDHWHDAEAETRVDDAQARIEAWRNLSNTYVQLPTIKAMLARRRGHPGWMRVRPPLVELTQPEIDRVWSVMSELEGGPQ